jgi:hypothetical protein
LVWSFALLLVVAIVHRAGVVSDALARVGPDRATFARIAEPMPGRFGPVTITHRKLVDIVCAPHHPRPYKVCVTIAGGRVLHVHPKPAL